MKAIDTYINEKLVLNKDNIKDYAVEPYFCDAKTFKKDDILFSNPNIDHKPQIEGKPGIPSFYKVTDADKKRVKVAPIRDKLVSGDRKNGECMPDDNVVYRDCWLKIDDDVLIFYGGNILYLWDGMPVKYYNK